MQGKEEISEVTRSKNRRKFTTSLGDSSGSAPAFARRIKHYAPILIHSSAMNSSLREQFFRNTVLVVNQMIYLVQIKPQLAQQQGAKQ
jgi:hypothetical protein